jgi:hypothetical protein
MKGYKAPDLNASRLRKPVKRILSKEFFKDFREKHPELSSLDDSTIKKIVYTFNENIWKQVIENRDGVELPENLGYVFIGTCDFNKDTNINYGLSVKHSQEIKNRNLESDSKLAKIFYTNYQTKYKFANRELWGFQAIRQFKRSVAAEYPKAWQKYIAVDSYKKVSEMFGKEMRKLSAKKMQKNILELYDEFEFN